LRARFPVAAGRFHRAVSVVVAQHAAPYFSQLRHPEIVFPFRLKAEK
jgi:hypothetical protein